jgi:uncharacterized protein YjbJ (UPF0337 family)
MALYAGALTNQQAVVNLPVSLIQTRYCSHQLHPKGNIMNKDQVKGQAKNIAGKVQEATGKLVDSKSQEAKGVKLQVEGTAQKGYGDAKEVVKDTRHAAEHAIKSHS